MAEQKLLNIIISRVDGPVFSGDVISVTLPGSDGELTLLADHEPFISSLKKGVITVRTQEGDTTIEIESGTLELSNNQATVLI